MKPHEFSAREIKAEGRSLSPEFVRQVLEPTVNVCPQDGQDEELFKNATREDLIAVVRDLKVRLRASSERNMELMAAARRFVRDVFP